MEEEFYHLKFQHHKWGVYGPNYMSRKRWLLKLLNNCHEVLDVGCGIGTLTIEIAKRGCKVTAIDISKEAINYARKRFGYLGLNVNFEVADIFSYNPEKEFDCIICFDVLEHIQNDLEAIRKMYSMLKEGGKLIVHVPANMSLWSRFDVEAGHVRRYDKDELKRKLLECGFRDVLVIGYGFPLLYIYTKLKIRRVEKFGSQVASQPPKIIQRFYPYISKILDTALRIDDMFTFSRHYVNLIAVGHKKKS